MQIFSKWNTSSSLFSTIRHHIGSDCANLTAVKNNFFVIVSVPYTVSERSAINICIINTQIVQIFSKWNTSSSLFSTIRHRHIGSECANLTAVKEMLLLQNNFFLLLFLYLIRCICFVLSLFTALYRLFVLYSIRCYSTRLFATGNNVTNYRYIQYLTRKYSRGMPRRKLHSVWLNSLASRLVDFWQFPLVSWWLVKLSFFAILRCYTVRTKH